jgi:hypothetical protein
VAIHAIGDSKYVGKTPAPRPANLYRRQDAITRQLPNCARRKLKQMSDLLASEEQSTAWRINRMRRAVKNCGGLCSGRHI